MATTITSFDYSALASYYSAGGSASISQRAAALRNGELKDLLASRENKVATAPWQETQTAEEDTSLSAVQQRVFQNTPFIDENDALFDRDDLDNDSKALFAAYKAIRRLNEIATYAQTRQGTAQSVLLDKIFQKGVDELEKFLATTKLDTLSLTLGELQDSMQSTVVLPIESSAPHFVGATILENRDDPIPGLSASDSFTIEAVGSDGTQRSATITLGDISADPNDYTVDAVPTYVNQQLLDAGISSQFQVERTSETQYGFRMILGYNETVTLTADPATEDSAVFLAGRRGSGVLGSGFVTKLQDLYSSNPTQPYYEQIDSSDAADTASGIAVGPDGSTYVVGTTAGDLGVQGVDPANNDVFLGKYDPAGNLVWTERLGAPTDGAGYGVAVDADGNVVVTGQVRGTLTTTATGGNLDTFVSKFDSTGQELWTRQAGPFADDAGLSISVDETGNIFVAGYARSALDNTQSYGGGLDATLIKLDSSGTLIYNRNFGDSGDEQHTAIKASGGNVYLAGMDSGVGFVRRYADGTATAQNWETTFPVDANGKVSGIDLDASGDVYVTGTTSNASLFSTPVNAHQGGTDAFVAKLSGADGSVSYGTYIGTTADDQGFAISLDPASQELYLTGETAGTLAGETNSGVNDAFVVKLDGTGAESWRHQFGGGFDQRGTSIAFVSTGTNVLTRLGLPNGEIMPDVSETVTSATTARPGQYFYISVDGGPQTRIEIEDDSSFGFLAFRMRGAIGTTAGVARFTKDSIDGRYLEIIANPGHTIEITAGRGDQNALPVLGLTAGRLFGGPTEEEEEAEDYVETEFGLGFTADINVKKESAALDAVTLLENAELTVKKAYRLLTQGPDEDFTKSQGVASEYLTNKIADYQAALDRLTSSSSSSNSNATYLTGGLGASLTV